jgi:hypothetical protein
MASAETVELLTWVASEPRGYREAIEVWKTNCPRHSLWEDALGEGLIRIVRNGAESQVALTPAGEAALSRA